MKSRVTNSAGWVLVTMAILLLAIAQRLDLLVIVAPVAAVVSYCAGRASKIGERKI